ncbi:anhydro-N-acetylmuramic acid kinase [Echinimonas agarilytica]|uniref:Anhydro-N-acetylmuramic acid kinase n=1 Tax=Echinimonas agarilytica TaxID=1215918 RepID=A0AA41W4S9_9GAMM|nr:anhydro-N-acetylmuramic acid kinase [Echinimonas agarilytica]MCM2678659.1 anhydro-N-acetylmuramic acid kinase [Echinimonas agarilytica]
MSKYYIGLMTGTSMDGLDAALVQFEDHQLTLIAAETFPLPDTLVTLCQRLCNPGHDDLDSYGRAHQWLGEFSASAVNLLLQKAQISASDIIAIGSHGQTVRHRPDIDHRFTLQLGDAAIIAELTGIDTVADFRSMDMAAGGQGAPLVPAFHAWLMGEQQEPTVVLNLGGIGNLTYLPAHSDAIFGFDTGPGNTLIDQWCQVHTGQPYDANGDWGRSGHVDHELLANLMTDEYFHRPAPKSTGREYFNMTWLNQYLSDLQQHKSSDVQATLHALTVHSIADAIRPLARAKTHIYVCGGGAHNGLLMEQLQESMPTHPVATTEQIGLHPDWVEAACFAWLAHCYVKRIPANVPKVTGARGYRVLGCLYPSQNLTKE